VSTDSHSSIQYSLSPQSLQSERAADAPSTDGGARLDSPHWPLRRSPCHLANTVCVVCCKHTHDHKNDKNIYIFFAPTTDRTRPARRRDGRSATARAHGAAAGAARGGARGRANTNTSVVMDIYGMRFPRVRLRESTRDV